MKYLPCMFFALLALAAVAPAQQPDPMMGTGGPATLLVDGVSAEHNGILRTFDKADGEQVRLTGVNLMTQQGSWSYLLMTLVPAGALGVPGVPGLPGIYAAPMAPPPFTTIFAGEGPLGPMGVIVFDIGLPPGLDAAFDIAFQLGVVHTGPPVFGLNYQGLTLLGSPVAVVR